MNRLLILVLLFMLDGYAGSCSAEGNDSLRIRNFVVKSCIALTKSKPRDDEVDSMCSKFGLYKNFPSKYPAFLDTLLNSLAFATCVYSGYIDEYVQGVPEDELESGIANYETNLKDSTQMHCWDLDRKIINELQSLRFAKQDFANGIISESALKKRMFANKFYDDENMGAHNYVVSTFNFLFHRNPTRYELREGEKFINGSAYGVLFLKTGNSKEDYLDALFSSDEYRESEINYWFGRLLNRSPTLSEQVDFMTLSNDTNLRLVIKKILSEKLYAGDKDKDKVKTADELLCISYEDLYGECISTSDETKFKRSIEGSGDKDLCRNNYINCMLFPENEGLSMNLNSDSSYYDKFKDSPRMSSCRDADPFLVLAGYCAYFVFESGPNFFKSMSDFIAWQRKNTPHNPMCINPGGPENNNPEDNLSVIARARLHVLNTKDWVIKYPGEYRIILNQFDSCFGLWYKQHSGTHTDFINYYTEKIGHDADKECKVLFNASPTGLIGGFRAITIPNDTDMRRNSKKFINEAYENLYIRMPTPEETEYLETFINDNKSLTAKQFYYAMMTNEEYKYY